jgi:hypothetical protein
MPSAAEVYRSCVSELGRCAERDEMLTRLRAGHQADAHGWCCHPGHAVHWERHPCPTLRLAAMVEHA